MIQDSIDKDLKEAMLSGDKVKTETLRNLKSALQNEAIRLNLKDSGLNEEQTQKVLVREAKKRQEAADIYNGASENTRADAELAEKSIVEAYLPEPVGEAEVEKLVNEEVSKLENPSPADMGRIIGVVRSRVGAQANGALIARLVKQALGQ